MPSGPQGPGLSRVACIVKWQCVSELKTMVSEQYQLGLGLLGGIKKSDLPPPGPLRGQASPPCRPSLVFQWLPVYLGRACAFRWCS